MTERIFRIEMMAPLEELEMGLARMARTVSLLRKFKNPEKGQVLNNQGIVIGRWECIDIPADESRPTEKRGCGECGKKKSSGSENGGGLNH